MSDPTCWYVKGNRTRRMKFHGFGWRIEVLEEPEEKEAYWREDRPAYPATMLQGFQMLHERLTTDKGDMDITEVASALEDCMRTLTKCVRHGIPKLVR